MNIFFLPQVCRVLIRSELHPTGWNKEVMLSNVGIKQLKRLNNVFMKISCVRFLLS